MYNTFIENNITMVLQGLIKCFRESAPVSSAELALDVIAQFAKYTKPETAFNVLLPLIYNETSVIQQTV